MRSISFRFIVFAILSFQVIFCFAERPLPYDRLCKINVTLKTTIQKTGYKTTDQPVNTEYGTYVKNLTTAKKVHVSLPLLSPDLVILIEAYAVFKDYQTKELRVEQLPTEGIDFKTYSFYMATEKTRERWMYADDGRVSETGEKILGWFVRVISANQVIGVASSSPTYDELAQKPDKLSEFITKNK